MAVCCLVFETPFATLPPAGQFAPVVTWRVLFHLEPTYGPAHRSAFAERASFGCV